jgi:Na+/melibiose symporter-like transporter
VARNGLTTGVTPGRLVFRAIGALSILMVSGWHDVLPERYQSKLPWIMITLWVFGICLFIFNLFWINAQQSRSNAKENKYMRSHGLAEYQYRPLIIRILQQWLQSP